MNISNINVRITESDVLGIINENLDIKEFSINDIKIGEVISITGVYKKGISFKFQVILGLGSVNDNVLKLKILKLKMGIFPIWTSLANVIVKNMLKTFKNIGITLNKRVVFVDFNILCKYIKSVQFVLKHITLFKNSADVCLENLVYKDNLEKHEDILSLDDLKDKINDEVKKENKDEYSEFRKKITKNFDGKHKCIGEYALLIPDIVVLLYRLMKDDRINKKTKGLIGSLIAYLALPIDIIPDSIPVIGSMDDFGIGFMLLDKIIDSVPEKIILEHWQGKDNIVLKVKEIKNMLFASIGRKNTIVALNGCIIGMKKLLNRKNK